MNTQKHTLKHVLTHFNTSRSTLYKVLKKQKIATKKEGRIAYISDTDFTHLKETCFLTKKNTNHETGENADLIQHLKQQVRKEQEKNENLQTENKELSQEIGRWQGRASTLEEQNIKLLEQSAPKNTSTIIEANMVESEPTPEKKAEKIGIFQKIINLRF